MEGYILSEHNHRQLLVPKGFAHGFVTLTPNVNFMYKCDNYYNAAADGGIAFNDPALAIDWPIAPEKRLRQKRIKTSNLKKNLSGKSVYLWRNLRKSRRVSIMKKSS